VIDSGTLPARAHELLASWPAPDEHQEALRRAYLQHLDRHRDGLWRSCREGHLTSSALIVDPSAHRVLLTLHPGVGRWLQTGGHCEVTDTDLAEAAGREAREESGITEISIQSVPLRLDRHQVTCRADDGHRSVLDHLDVQWLALADSRHSPVCSDESVDVRWWDWHELPDGPTGADASVHALVAAAIERLQQ
jgi:8-oxo-dGTP pyrophosphatase MutT (NUDIX family)